MPALHLVLQDVRRGDEVVDGQREGRRVGEVGVDEVLTVSLPWIAMADCAICLAHVARADALGTRGSARVPRRPPSW